MKQTFTQLLVPIFVAMTLMSCGPEQNGDNNGEDPCEPTNDGSEICDGIDNDCDGAVDEEASDAKRYYPDEDGDGFGDETSGMLRCTPPEGAVEVSGDCNDSESAVYPGAPEVCDNLDNDCNNSIDQDNVEPRACDNQSGVCEGSVTITCDVDGYAACGESQFGGLYEDDDDEAWQCDGKDNDCDGLVDEACCGANNNSAVPTPSELGLVRGPDSSYPGERQIDPVIIAAAEGAPVDASFLAAWRSENKEIKLQHLDAAGDPLLDPTSLRTGRRITGLTVTQTPQGYDVIWGGYIVDSQNAYADLRVQPYDVDLSERDNATDLKNLRTDTNDKHAFTRLEAVNRDGNIVVGYVDYLETYSVTSGPVKYRVAEAVHYNAFDRLNSSTELVLGGSGFSSLLPDIDVVPHKAGFLVTWLAPGRDALEGRTFDADSTPTGTFTLSAPDRTNTPIAAMSLSDGRVVLLSSVEGENGVTLEYNIVDPVSGDEITSETLTAEDLRAVSPVLHPFDSNADGRVDRASLVWTRTGLDTELAGGMLDVRADAVSLTQSTGLLSVPDEVMTVDLGAQDTRLGITWVEGSNVQYIPLSRSGVAVCR